MPLLPLERPPTRPAAWSPHDDVPLVLAAQAGDAAAFDFLYRRHARVVHAVLIGRATREDVDDLVQEAFLAAWRRLATLRDPAAFGGWVVTIARRQRIDHARRLSGVARAPTAPLAPIGSGAAEPASTEAPADDRLDAQRALEAIRALPEAYRETLVLRLVEGMTGPEIAERTGLTPESVRVNLCRGMKLLRQVLETTPAARMRS